MKLDNNYIIMAKIWMLDTETTGTPRQKGFDNYYSYTQLDKYNNSRLLQVGIIEFDKLPNEEYQEVERYNFIINSGDYKVQKSKYHRIDQQQVNKDGIRMHEFVEFIKNKLEKVNLIVAHNVKFDINIMASEMYRHGLIDEAKKITNIRTFCTAKTTSTLTKIKIKTRNGVKYKSPKLIELYRFLFNKNPDNMANLHDAIADCEVLAKCFFRLVETWNFSQIQDLFP